MTVGKAWDFCRAYELPSLDALLGPVPVPRAAPGSSVARREEKIYEDNDEFDLKICPACGGLSPKYICGSSDHIKQPGEPEPDEEQIA